MMLAVGYDDRPRNLFTVYALIKFHSVKMYSTKGFAMTTSLSSHQRLQIAQITAMEDEILVSGYRKAFCSCPEFIERCYQSVIHRSFLTDKFLHSIRHDQPKDLPTSLTSWTVKEAGVITRPRNARLPRCYVI